MYRFKNEYSIVWYNYGYINTPGKPIHACKYKKGCTYLEGGLSERGRVRKTEKKRT